MKRIWKRNALIVCCMTAFAATQTACSVIDEDTDDCRAEYDATYELHLITNEEHEIQRVLGEGADTDIVEALRTDIAEALREHLKNFFSYSGRDLDLSFYDLKGFLPRAEQEQLQMDGQPVKHVYLSLPVGEYRHNMTANIADYGAAEKKNFDLSWYEARVALPLDGPEPAFDGAFTPSFGFPWEEGIDRDLPADYIPPVSTPSMKTGMFAGRRNLISPTYGSYKEYNEPNVREQYTFTQPLFITNSAAALILDPRTAQFSDVKIFTTGFATDFNVADSAFIFDNFPLIIADQVQLHNTNWMLFCATSFPSREPAGNKAAAQTRAIDTSVYPDQPPYRVDTDEPFLYGDCGLNIWRYECYVKLVDKDGRESVTRTLINIRHPLRAGQLKIIKAYIDNEGIIRLNENEVGVSVDLKWQKGYVFNPIIGLKD